MATSNNLETKQRTSELRKESGAITTNDPFVSFLYSLMRDELPAGTVEQMARDVCLARNQDVIFTNGYLAQYAQNLVKMMREQRSPGEHSVL